MDPSGMPSGAVGGGSDLRDRATSHRTCQPLTASHWPASAKAALLDLLGLLLDPVIDRLTFRPSSRHHGRGPGGPADEGTMERIETPTQAEERPPKPLGFERLRLRFRDPALESAFRTYRF